MKIQRALRLLLPAMFVFTLTISVSPAMPSYAQGGSRTFSETGKTVKGPFLAYWDSHGALAQQGFPISEEMQEVSETDGKNYTVQYFERAVFELHPELPAPNNVLLSLLGNFLYKQKYPSGAPNQQPNADLNFQVFNETGKRVGGIFLDYWKSHGALAQQGFPISEEFTEVSSLNGQPYKVQYFERAVFEFHPENAPPFNVLLSQLGKFRYDAKYGSGGPRPTTPPSQPTTPPSQPTAQPTVAGQLPLPVKLTPADGQVLRVVPRVATFSWARVPGATSVTRYGIEIQVNINDWQRFDYKTGLTTTYTMKPFQSDYPGRWRVWATNTGVDPQNTDWSYFSFNTSATQYSGTWVNTEANAEGITKLVISNKGQSISVRGFESCPQEDCDWGTRTATFNGEPFTILFDFGRAGTHQLSLTLSDSAATTLIVEDVSSESGTNTYKLSKQP